MIFVGDIALPHRGAVKLSNFPIELKEKKWFGNLEGAIVKIDNKELNAVYNHIEAVENLIEEFNFKGFALANNHIFDTGRYQDTINFLNEKQIFHCGIGSNIYEANKEIVFEESGNQIVIINFGWEVIQCEITTGDNLGVNPLRKRHVLETIKSLVEKYPNAKIIPFMHWSYELESEPQPFERELAKKIIDLGAAGVIGCHPHRIGGFEIYENKPIVYSLGNWMFKQNHYMNGKLNFPDFCNSQLAFEWDFDMNLFKFHFFEYSRIESNLTYVKTENIDGEKINNYTPFKGLCNKKYKKWYKKHHYHKNKGLPIYYWTDNVLLIFVKNKLIKLRDKLLKIIFNKGK